MIPHPSLTGLQTWTSQHRASGTADRSSMAVAPAPSSAQQLIDLSGSDGPAENEHPHKRPRLDTTVSGLGGDGRTPSSRSADARSATTGSNPTRPSAVSGRGRPAYSFQELVADTYGGNVFAGNVTPGSQTSKPPSPPPFPVRPWTHTPARLSQVENEGLSNNMRGRGKQMANNSTEVADYAPWSRTGNHPEDRLSDLNVKAGNFDRVPGPNTNSDIQSHASKLSSQLKNHSSLQLLSSVFAAALEKRQINEKISSASTFKPPPRVTLTDNKREAWLRDLANSSVPLRRLSRTIPHGIRGKVLLDQCLGKGVPIGRAVWLAKCVGANEIRAFKRKGTSGSLSQGLETKWVREWTLSVQQFTAGVISACGKPDWRNKMTYA
ncbi:hypothetical protein EIK77_004366 [Talaromyces pinophilus]|nr:hypothetical protein EIK77_004366 [Talaromyces pinophilus]